MSYLLSIYMQIGVNIGNYKTFLESNLKVKINSKCCYTKIGWGSFIKL